MQSLSDNEGEPQRSTKLKRATNSNLARLSPALIKTCERHTLQLGPEAMPVFTRDQESLHHICSDEISIKLV